MDVTQHAAPGAHDRTRVVVLFLDPWLAYSPTTINLCDLLAERADLLLISSDAVMARRDDFRRPYVRRLRLPFFLQSYVIEPLHRLLAKKHPLLSSSVFRWARAATAYWELREISADVVIGVDWLAFLVAALRYGKAHMVSLELGVDDWVPRTPLVFRILSVLSQSEERLGQLPSGPHLDRFVVQNSPIFEEHPMPARAPGDLLYAGMARESFGFTAILRWLRTREDLRLTVVGALSPESADRYRRDFADILDSPRVRFVSDYVDQKDLIRVLSTHRVGICLYDLSLVGPERRANFLHVPSGKMFSYLAAGLPVLGTRLPGLRLVGERGAGALVRSHEPEELTKALEEIEGRYAEACRAALGIARECSFEKLAAPYLDYLTAPRR